MIEVPRWFLLLAVAGCYPGPSEIVLGHGYERFTAIGDGDELPIVMGIQGGYHVWGEVRARFVDPRQLRLEFTLTGAWA